MAIIAASIEPNGWVLRLDVTGSLGTFASYALDPDGSPRVTLTSSHAGFVKSAGQAIAGTMVRSLVGTKPLRQPVNPASPTTPVIDETDLGGGTIRVRIALSEHVYATDTGLQLAVLAGWRTGEAAGSGIGVTNTSSIAAPIPIMRWALLPYNVTSGAFTVAMLVVSHHPHGLEPVAGVKFTATDGTGIKTVWTTRLSTDTSHGDALRCYTASIDPAAATALTAGLLRVDAEIYPWLGAMRSTDPAGTKSMATARTDGFSEAAEAPWIIGYDPAGTRYNDRWLYVDPVNGTTTASSAMVATTLAAAKAIAAGSRPRDINTALQALYLMNRTLPAANGQAAQARSGDGARLVLAPGTHDGAGAGGITSGLTIAEIPVRVIGDPDDANPRANCVLRTNIGVNRGQRLYWGSLTLEIGGSALAGTATGFNILENFTVRGKSGSESSGTAPFTAGASAGLRTVALANGRWWQTVATIGGGNVRPALVRNVETSRSIGSYTLATRNRLIPASEDGFVGSLVFNAYGSSGIDDVICAYNDIRSLRGRAWAPSVVAAATAGTPNPSTRRQVLLGNVVERIGNDAQPFYSIGEDASATMSYNIIEANSFIGDRSNTFYSDPFPTTLAETNSQRNQAYVNRVANNAFDWLPTKHDDFNDSATAALRGSSNGYRPQMVEAWSMLYGVDHEANVDTRRTGGSLFALEYSGRRSVAGYAGALAPNYTDDRSILGPLGASAIGGGNYRPQAATPLAGRGLRANSDVDADGVMRPIGFTAGAFQLPAVDLAPATARSTSRAGAALLGWTATLLPAGARHGLSGAAQVQWAVTLAPAGGASALGGPATIVEPVLYLQGAILPIIGGPAQVRWSAALAPHDSRVEQWAATADLSLQAMLLPAAGRMASHGSSPVLATAGPATLAPVTSQLLLSASVPLALRGDAGAAATLIVGPDPRTLIPNRN